ncbi:SBBP repeat-containing protein [Paenibacillus methanolicus]|uniref:Beta-propeller repeat-containing protein n=1 Tax=Paenibacillus methanolicus TaxID=582686 RepID=A0A5S5C7X6_9BACL|nr:SBBP repeat-containing protein [Paenibacillus methanolicus]TYP74496.1 beta-propeller repeat-containing protein [Paenibacillus methanolicus]
MDDRFRFEARGPGYRYAFGSDRVWLSFHRANPVENGGEAHGVTLVWELLNARPGLVPEGVSADQGTFSYFRGQDPAYHYANIPLYREVAYRQVWPGIDLVFQACEGKLKYDVILSPGARLEDVKLLCQGAEELRMDDDGNLQFVTPLGTFADLKPVAYQSIENVVKPVECRFALRKEADGSRSVGFETGEEYRPDYALVIDPILAFSTYLGGTDFDQGHAIAVDSAGNVYVTGDTGSADFPVTPGAFDTTLGGTTDVFVTKFDPTGTALVYSTYLGGSGTGDQGFGIAVDASGHAYVTGAAQSADFPVTPGAFQTDFGGGIDGFVTKLNPAGTALVYSTYLGGGGSDIGRGIAVDASGNAYMTGETTSADFPVTPGAFQTMIGGGSDAFVAKLNPAGTALVYSTYLGGSGGDFGRGGIAIDASGSAYVAGTTQSANFPVTPGCVQPLFGGVQDAFAAKLNPLGTGLVYSTYLGGTSSDSGESIAIDASGNAYVTGQTFSADFPVTAGAFDTTFEPTNMAYITKVNALGSALVYSTYLGGSGGNNEGRGITVDSFGHASVTGSTSAADFPVTPDAIQPLYGDNQDAFVTRLNPSGSALIFSTYLGGSGPGLDLGRKIASDASGNLYVVGDTESTDFPVTAQAFQPELAGSRDAFVAKIQFAGAFSTGVLDNRSGAGMLASGLHVLISNENADEFAVIEIVAFYLSGTDRIPYAHELFSLAPNTVAARNFAASFDAFEIQYAISGLAAGDTLVSVFPTDGNGNATASGRVLPTEAAPVFRITPVP